MLPILLPYNILCWYYDSLKNWIAPLTMVNTTPVWLFVSECTAKAASVYQSIMVILLVFNVIFSSRVSWGYLIILNIFLQASLSGTLNIVHNNYTVSWMMGLARLHKNITLAILVRNTSDLSESIFVVLVLSVKTIMLLGSSKCSFSSLLPCEENFRLFYQFIFRVNFHLSWCCVIQSHGWIVMDITSIRIIIFFILICLLGPLNEIVNNILVRMRHFKVIDMPFNWHFLMVYHIVVHTGIIIIYFETNGLQILT